MRFCKVQCQANRITHAVSPPVVQHLQRPPAPPRWCSATRPASDRRESWGCKLAPGAVGDGVHAPAQAHVLAHCGPGTARRGAARRCGGVPGAGGVTRGRRRLPRRWRGRQDDCSGAGRRFPRQRTAQAHGERNERDRDERSKTWSLQSLCYLNCI